MPMPSISAARKQCSHLAGVIANCSAMQTFGATGEVKPGLAQEIRQLEEKKAALLAEKKITVTEYWHVVGLDAFINDHLDDGFTRLRAAHTTVTA